MPSVALQHSQNDRRPRLNEVENQLAVSRALAPPNPRPTEENVRGYIVLISAHFQGFCRDLHSESATAVVMRVRASLRPLIQAQFTSNRALDHGNPILHNLRKDFERFDFVMDLPGADPENPTRLHDLS